MKRILPHIYLENCHEAIHFYKETFGAEIKNEKLSDELDMFKGHEGKYIHAELHINENCVVYFADVFSPITQGTNLWLMIDLETEEEINNLYRSLSKDGSIKMELQNTFWGSKYAVVTDRYGITWELNLAK